MITLIFQNNYLLAQAFQSMYYDSILNYHLVISHYLISPTNRVITIFKLVTIHGYSLRRSVLGRTQSRVIQVNTLDGPQPAALPAPGPAL